MRKFKVRMDWHEPEDGVEVHCGDPSYAAVEGIEELYNRGDGWEWNFPATVIVTDGQLTWRVEIERDWNPVFYASKTLEAPV